MHPDIKLLNELGYRTRQCSPYHYHVYFDGTLLNVWISGRGKKWMPETPCPAKEYTDIQDIISVIESKNTAKEQHDKDLKGIMDRLRKTQ